jgi:hypothetical protein
MKAQCIQAVAQAIGRTLTQQELKDIEARVRRQLQSMAREDQARFLSLPANARLLEAGQRAAAELVHEATLKKVRVALTIMAHDRVQAYMKDAAARGIDKLDALDRLIAFKADGKSGVQSAETRARSVRDNALRQLLDAFEASDPKFFGLLENREGVRDLTREMFGEQTGNAVAKKGAAAWHTVAEALRKQFNAAGGDIGKLINWALPQHHSQLRVAKAGRDAWIADILPKLDRGQYMKDDGSRFTDAEMQKFLGDVWETIATGGVNKIEPGQVRGAGMRANRNADPRALHFRDADGYLDYQTKYGERDLYGVMVAHVGRLAKDVAMLETFGPNPDHAYAYFRDLAVTEGAKANPRSAGKLKERSTKLDNLYDFVAGRTQPVANEYIARGFDTLRNWLVATRLGSAFVTSFSDEATLYLTAHINNLPEMQVFRNELAAMNPANKVEKRLAQRAGLALETMIGELNRFGQDGLGASFSSKLANTTMRLSGLNAITDARKRAFGVTMMDAIGSLTRTVADVKKLDPTDWRMLRSKGISDKDWAVWRLAEVEKWNDTNSTMLTPESIARIPDADLAAAGLTPKDRQEGVLKLLGAVLEEVDVAVISPGARERAMMGAGIQRGTMKGELARSFWLFKSFPMAMITRHWMRGNGMETAGGKAAYIASLVIATTVLGALSLEVDQVLQGKDPRTLNPFAKGGVRDILAAVLKGGSLGIYGDFLFSEATQGKQQSPMAAVAGPVGGLVEEALNLTQGNFVQLMQGKETHAGAEAIRFIKGNTPGANLWYAKAALDHLIWNQAAEYLSPGYLSSMRSRARREFGQDFYWGPDSAVPTRGPDLSRIVEQ